MTLSPTDREALAAAKAALEHPGLPAKLAGLIGMPVETIGNISGGLRVTEHPVSGSGPHALDEFSSLPSLPPAWHTRREAGNGEAVSVRRAKLWRRQAYEERNYQQLDVRRAGSLVRRQKCPGFKVVGSEWARPVRFVLTLNCCRLFCAASKQRHRFGYFPAGPVVQTILKVLADAWQVVMNVNTDRPQ